MRIALISDVHGNDIAFRAVAKDIDRVGVDAIVSLGDVAQGGPQPAEALARLRAMECRMVMGNSDDFLLEVPSDSPEPITESQLEMREWTVRTLDAGDLEFMRSFEPTVSIQTDAGPVLCFHGSPQSYDDVLLPEADESSLVPYEGHEASLLAGGHTHKQWSRRVGESLFVNPGSVGLPYDHHQPVEDFKMTPVAEYAIVFTARGGPAAEFRRVPFSVEEVRAVTEASGCPNAGEYASWWR